MAMGWTDRDRVLQGTGFDGQRVRFGPYRDADFGGAGGERLQRQSHRFLAHRGNLQSVPGESSGEVPGKFQFQRGGERARAPVLDADREGHSVARGGGAWQDRHDLQWSGHCAGVFGRSVAVVVSDLGQHVRAPVSVELTWN